MTDYATALIDFFNKPDDVLDPTMDRINDTLDRLLERFESVDDELGEFDGLDDLEYRVAGLKVAQPAIDSAVADIVEATGSLELALTFLTVGYALTDRD